MKKWYVLNTHVRAEAKAAFHIHRQGFECYLPRYMKRCRHARPLSRCGVFTRVRARVADRRSVRA